ncbi:MAG: YbhB/YbcL family Raf kinase inhibitor-like protein [Bauldia sp.]|nr:YbhB/YbcL family Raf kinase inhibitor-like protein [Bauldia sp.]
MRLVSSSFEHSAEMAQKHGKRFDNISPALSWSDAPAGTLSFALSMIDRYPAVDGFVHWLVADLAPDLTSLPEGAGDGSMPAPAREIEPYAGPYPPSDTHPYEFTLYALGTERLGIREGASLRQFENALAPVTLATATLVGTFTKR